MSLLCIASGSSFAQLQPNHNTSRTKFYKKKPQKHGLALTLLIRLLFGRLPSSPLFCEDIPEPHGEAGQRHSGYQEDPKISWK
ncbi:hypothetical protein BJY00DRAFT_274481 [Aspergillus carlsbadensis]|nr:hypothetical protein BJY00DRAFT_274481 [Aspergillus carlsbadensis]